LNRFEGLPYHEIAEKMNLSNKTIEYHISRALRELRISLKYLYLLAPFLFLFC
ncbi:MAG: sigma factor-like helix-turn-helix DNA-binding protein, partial [Paludibacter sp.]